MAFYCEPLFCKVDSIHRLLALTVPVVMTFRFTCDNQALLKKIVECKMNDKTFSVYLLCCQYIIILYSNVNSTSAPPDLEACNNRSEITNWYKCFGLKFQVTRFFSHCIAL